ncbi:nucleoside hydrolase [Solirubrobacter sp. CPCC 204708]|uniref:Nucleoside hydrolase n=1 Tax=Solirubrobacter deserti TaxID=2282478 RepID=A0ABT4RUK5_9ACTN|nr:nucleoside hydrolase [Solirubrobacter deserti]MBE2320974.1 nucleoside hydrolase [Solirubrobacter deserti]MDA0142268.1 nucleoside hydrolase [Solirubrobacter deserti]
MDVVIDTDPGIGTVGVDPEDSLALALAFASGELDVRAVTCVQGNVPVRHSFASAARVLELLDRQHVPLAAGHERPLGGAARHEQLRRLAESGRRARVLPAAEGPLAEPRAVELIVRTAREHAPLTVIAIGPLTNLASALLADPSLPDRLERVVVMGGAFETPGNVTPTAEFNFFMDPEAANVVLASGLTPVLLGLDICHRTHLTPEQLTQVGFHSPFGRFLRRVSDEWLHGSDDGPHLYDSLAVACAVNSDLFEYTPALVHVETASEPLAGTSAAWLPGRASAWSRPDRPDNALIATDVDLEAFESLFGARVLARL